MERRFLNNAECRVEERDSIPRIVGVAAVYYDETRDTEYELWEGVRERIMPGAFADVLDNDVRALFNHSPDNVLGRTSAGTLTLSDSAEGLRYEVKVDGTHIAHDVVRFLERGDVSGSSFAFSVSDEHWDKEDGDDIRVITKIGTLYDVGPVTYPAYTATHSGVRNDTDADDARASLAEWTQRHERVRAARVKRARARLIEMGL